MENLYKIALPVSVDTLFTYKVPDSADAGDLTGKRVLVPFRNRSLTGVIIEKEEKSNLKKIREIEEIIDTEPVINREMISLCKWISNYYLAPIGETTKLALPPGNFFESKRKVVLSREISDNFIEKTAKNAPKRAKILKVLKGIKAPVETRLLAKRTGSVSINEQLDLLYEQGLVDFKDSIETGIRDIYRKIVKLNPAISGREDLSAIIESIEKSAPKQALVLTYLMKNKIEEIFINDFQKELNVSLSVFESLEKKGIIEIDNKRVDRSKTKVTESLGKGNELNLNLSLPQQRIVDSILRSFKKNRHEVSLIYGVTGSGKTLIYLHLIKKVLDEGKTVLIMVPEISLTPQLIDRFEFVFPGIVSVIHSRLSKGERYDAWKNILNGQSQIVIGARSALFSPLIKPGLIIVDEEHDGSYKQESPEPRYNARDCAVVRGSIENIPVVLGSATPSLESYHNAISGKYKYYRMNERSDGARLPEIKIIDMKTAYNEGQVKGRFSKYLLSGIKSKILKKEGSILLQNRRGFSALLYCSDCGFIPMCENCDVSLTYHRSEDKLKCHYCGYVTERYPECPECGGGDIKSVGFGTQRLEEELNELLAEENIDAAIDRFDLDTTSGKDAHRKILNKFKKGDTDVLIGTQMVAKGMDIDRVTLVGVVSADSQLYIPDFRASEKTFALITQVSGRAGRSPERRGSVIIQTLDPDNPSISLSLNNEYEKFATQELIIRREAEYPPFFRFTVIEFKSENENLCDIHSKIFFNILPANIKGFQKIGPAKPEISRIKKQFRRTIIIKYDKEYDKSGRKLRHILKKADELYSAKHKTSKVFHKIDIDSYSAM